MMSTVYIFFSFEVRESITHEIQLKFLFYQTLSKSMGNAIPVSTGENTFGKKDNTLVPDKTFQYTNMTEDQKTQYLIGVPCIAKETRFFPI